MLFCNLVLDASGKGKSGFAYGYLADLGNYDACIGISRKENLDGKQVDLNGKYCMVSLRFPLPPKPERNWIGAMRIDFKEPELKDTIYEYYGNHTELFYHETFSFAVCMPAACEREDLDAVLQDCKSPE